MLVKKQKYQVSALIFHRKKIQKFYRFCLWLSIKLKNLFALRVDVLKIVKKVTLKISSPAIEKPSKIILIDRYQPFSAILRIVLFEFTTN